MSDVDYDIGMIKMRKNMVTVWLLAAIKEKQLQRFQSECKSQFQANNCL